ncbi:uncharacterized protein LOC141645823 [Silene latifolia]|uniref:uncharacterized protein LOC141645823 n=1 Tax=Silene latifolia TaxID=37657 RepID=UPI003D77A107
MSQPTTKALSIDQHGPYGGSDHPTFNFILGPGEEITKVHVECGYITDALGFEIVDQLGNVETRWTDGTVTGKVKSKNTKVGFHESRTINLAGETITKISGHEGDYGEQGRHVAQLRIHTDMNAGGYGPFGLMRNCTNIKAFESPDTPPGAVIGFFGTQGTYTNASLRNLGVTIKK